MCNYLRHKIAQNYPYVPAPDALPLPRVLAVTSWPWGGPGGLSAILGHISSHTLHAIDSIRSESDYKSVLILIGPRRALLAPGSCPILIP